MIENEKLSSAKLILVNNSTNKESFGYFQLRAYFFYFSFFVKTVIKYLQPHLAYSGNSCSKSDIEKAFGLKNLVWSSSSSYL